MEYFTLYTNPPAINPSYNIVKAILETVENPILYIFDDQILGRHRIVYSLSYIDIKKENRYTIYSGAEWSGDTAYIHRDKFIGEKDIYELFRLKPSQSHLIELALLKWRDKGKDGYIARTVMAYILHTRLNIDRLEKLNGYTVFLWRDIYRMDSKTKIYGKTKNIIYSVKPQYRLMITKRRDILTPSTFPIYTIEDNRIHYHSMNEIEIHYIGEANPISEDPIERMKKLIHSSPAVYIYNEKTKKMEKRPLILQPY